MVLSLKPTQISQNHTLENNVQTPNVYYFYRFAENKNDDKITKKCAMINDHIEPYDMCVVNAFDPKDNVNNVWIEGDDLLYLGVGKQSTCTWTQINNPKDKNSIEYLKGE